MEGKIEDNITLPKNTVDISDRLNQQLEFCREANMLKHVMRRIPNCNGNTLEDDAQHSWHLALMLMTLKEHAPADINLLKTMSLLIVHDMVEIYAGDTFAFDEIGKADKEKRETEAAELLFGLLPDDQMFELKGLWKEYEAKETKEAVFACVLDKFQATLMADMADGITWRENKIKLSQVLEYNRFVKEHNELIYSVQEDLIMKNVKLGNIIDDSSL